MDPSLKVAWEAPTFQHVHVARRVVRLCGWWLRQRRDADLVGFDQSDSTWLSHAKNAAVIQQALPKPRRYNPGRSRAIDSDRRRRWLSRRRTGARASDRELHRPHSQAPAENAVTSPGRARDQPTAGGIAGQR